MFLATEHQIKKSDFICLPCNRKAQSKWRRIRKESGKPVIPTQMPPSYHKEYAADYYQREGVAEIKRVRAKTSQAIRSGKLVRMPCEVCGEIKTEAHHDNYLKPFDVRWLCRKHHREYHDDLRRHNKAKGA